MINMLDTKTHVVLYYTIILYKSLVVSGQTYPLSSDNAVQWTAWSFFYENALYKPTFDIDTHLKHCCLCGILQRQACL